MSVFSLRGRVTKHGVHKIVKQAPCNSDACVTGTMFCSAVVRS